jgi:hypothetical protein
MNELDERLREDFAALAGGEPLDLGIDADRVIGTGHRVRRSRAIRCGVGGAALSLLAAVLAWTGLPVGGGPGHALVPAAPAVSPWPLHPAYFQNLEGLDLAKSTPFRRVELAVDPVGSGWNVTVTTSLGDGVQLARFTYHADQGVSVQRLSPQVAVALLPRAAQWWTAAMADPMVSPLFTDSMRVTGLDLTAVLLVFEDDEQADQLTGFLWAEPDGTLVDSVGSDVATAVVEVGGEKVTVFSDPGLRQLGYRLENGLATTVHTGREWPHAYPRLQGPRESGDSGTTWVLGDLLPAGAHDLSITLATEDGDWRTAELGGRTAYVVVARTQGDDQPITSLRYTDADGKVHTYPR